MKRLLEEKEETDMEAEEEDASQEVETPCAKAYVDLDDDEDLEEYWDKKEHERGTWHGVAGHREQDFRAVLRGGESEEAKGRPRFDSWQGNVKRGSDAQAWCRLKRYQGTMKFPLSLGEFEAMVLAKAWCHKMQYLFDSDREGLLTTPEMKTAAMDRLVESEDFQALRASDNPAMQVHIGKIDSIVPK
eukprot:459162-Lingulodinium_polyedra.AAC.1